MPACIRHLTIALLLFATGPALAADPVAESMFQEALKLMAAGQFADACPKLRASQKLEAKSGTLMTLGSCNEQIGKTATAWAQYKEAAALAHDEGRDDHAKKATELAAAIEPKLSKLQIDAQVDQDGVQLTVKLDGDVVLDGTFGVAFAIDPGKHVIEASAPGRRSWSLDLEIAPEPGTRAVEVPQLEAEEQPAPKPDPVVAPAPPPPAPPEPEPTAHEGGTPAWAWVVGAIGLASMGVSVAFAVDQQAAASELDDQCGGEARNLCPAGYDFDAAHARENRDFGLFLGFGIGGLALVATGIVGLVTAEPSATEATVQLLPSLGPGGGGLVLDARF